MKKIATLWMVMVLVALAGPSLLAQEVDTKQDDKQEQEQKVRRNPGEVQTLFDPHSGTGGYGAFTIGYTQINGRDAILMGGRGEWIIGHGFGLGLGGYGFVNDPIYNTVDQLNYSLAGGYGCTVLSELAERGEGKKLSQE